MDVLVNRGFENLSIHNFGEEKRTKVRAKAKPRFAGFIESQSFSDWLRKTVEENYLVIPRSTGAAPKELTINPPSIHTRVTPIHPLPQPGEFNCASLGGALRKLPCPVHRPGLNDFAVGRLEDLDRLLKTPAAATSVEVKTAGAEHHGFEVSSTSEAGPDSHDD